MKAPPRARRLPLAATLIALLLLAGASLGPAVAGWPRAESVRGLLRAMLAEPGPLANRPFPCAAGPLTTEDGRRLALEALERLRSIAPVPGQDAHLLGTAYCLLGEPEAARVLYQAGGAAPYARVQAAVLAAQAGDGERSAQLLAQAGLDTGEALELLAALVKELPGLDWRPHLRRLAGQDPQEQELWRLWLIAGSNLEQRQQYESARGWYEEGLALQEDSQASTYRSSLYLRAGRVYQVYNEPRDPQTALTYYDQALAMGQYFYPTEQANAHLYRGEVYRALKETYTPAQALAEYEQALALQPESYWVHLGIGHLYLHDLMDASRSEGYYRRALALNPELPYAYYHLGESHRLGGDPDGAEQWYRLALTRQPDYQPALDRLQALGAKP